MTDTPRNASDLTTLDSELQAEGTCDAFQAVAIDEVLAWLIEQTSKH